MSAHSPNQADLIKRHLARDLDRVEERAFLARLDREPELMRAWAAAYDARVDQAGLAAFVVRDPDTAHCFSVETLERYAKDDLDEPDRRTVASHLRCPLCGPEVRFLTAARSPTASERAESRAPVGQKNGTDHPRWRPLQPGIEIGGPAGEPSRGAPPRPVPDDRPPGGRQPSSSPWAFVAPRLRGFGFGVQAVGLAAALALIVVVVRPEGIKAPLDVERLAQPGAVNRAVTAAEIRSALPAGAVLAREACVLRWSADMETQTFGVRVFTEDLRMVASAHLLTEPSFHVPEETLRGLPIQTRLFWQVTAHLADGTEVNSPAFDLRLR